MSAQGEDELLGLREDRLERLSVLRELMGAAVELFDVERPIDGFLERLAESLGCVAVLVVERWILARLRHRRFSSLAELNEAMALLVTDGPSSATTCSRSSRSATAAAPP